MTRHQASYHTHTQVPTSCWEFPFPSTNRFFRYALPPIPFAPPLTASWSSLFMFSYVSRTR